MTLNSPGVEVTIIDESFYSTATPGTVPLFFIATASNKTAPDGISVAPSTVPSQANKLFIATSQRELIQNFGNPVFYSYQGTPIHGDELNEYGLHAAYSYLGTNNFCYVLRSDIDLAELEPSTLKPSGPAVAGTYWFDLQATKWGIFQANGNATPGSAWVSILPRVALLNDVDSTYFVPLATYGSDGDFAVVPMTASNYIFEKISGQWFQIGTLGWYQQHPTNILGAVSPGPITAGTTISLNGVQITFQGTSLQDVVDEINTASVTNISASISSNALLIQHTNAGDIIIQNVTGTPLSTLGITGGTYRGVRVFHNSDASYPDGSAAGSVWVKGNPANNGAVWSVKYFNGSTQQWLLLSAPFFQFNSTLNDGDANKDAAALSSLANSTIGNVYVGYDVATGDQQIRRWSGTRWEALVYEADLIEPVTDPSDGTLWYDPSLQVDIMVSNGENWVGYRRYYPNTDPNGIQISASPPTLQSTGAPLVANDLWLDSSDTENYPLMYRYNVTNQTWVLIDNTDHTTPFGVIFHDCRNDSGPSFTGIRNPGNYAYNSTLPYDLSLSDYVDPDAPNPELYPSGTLLFNTRYSTNNVKQWNENYFAAGGFDPNANFSLLSYSVGNTGYVFPPLASVGRWVTASGNQENGSPYMGRKSQRAMVVRAMAASINTNQDIRSEIVFYNLIAAPGYTELIPEMVGLNTDQKEIAFIVADTPIRLTPDGTSINNWATNAANVAGDGDNGLVTANDYVGIYYPWGLGTNTDGTEIMIPPSTVALRSIAYNDTVGYQWYAPAGYSRGIVTNASSVGYLDSAGDFSPVILNNGQRDILYENKINPIAFAPRRGLVIFGQKTLAATASALDRINVARLSCYISYSLDQILKPFLFEQNDIITRAAAKHTVESFFNSLVGLRGISDYAVVCDLTNNTPERQAANELWVDCAVLPIYAVEFIYVPVRIQTGTAADATKATGSLSTSASG